jgi:hypothetical protein
MGTCLAVGALCRGGGRPIHGLRARRMRSRIRTSCRVISALWNPIRVWPLRLCCSSFGLVDTTSSTRQCRNSACPIPLVRRGRGRVYAGRSVGCSGKATARIAACAAVWRERGVVFSSVEEVVAQLG